MQNEPMLITSGALTTAISSQRQSGSASELQRSDAAANSKELTETDHRVRMGRASDTTLSVFENLGKIYGGMWSAKYTDSPSEAFDLWAASLDGGQVGRLMAHCYDDLRSGSKWPPELGLLAVWANEPTETEYLQIRLRIMARQPADIFERYVLQTYGSLLKGESDRFYMRELKKFYRHAVTEWLEGGLFEGEVKALPSVSVVMPTDRAREDHRPTRRVKSKVNNIVERMRAAQAAQPAADSVN